MGRQDIYVVSQIAYIHERENDISINKNIRVIQEKNSQFTPNYIHGMEISVSIKNIARGTE